MDDKYYDDEIIREALKNIINGEYSLLGSLYQRKKIVRIGLIDYEMNMMS